MTVASVRTADVSGAAPVGKSPSGQVPRDYNFAADVLQLNLDAGRAGKPAYIDAHGVTKIGRAHV